MIVVKSAAISNCYMNVRLYLQDADVPHAHLRIRGVARAARNDAADLTLKIGPAP
jgi:hypothetical protein